MKTQNIVPEIKGRRFTTVKWITCHRMVGDKDQRWCGVSKFDTLKEAKESIHASVTNIARTGGITIEFQGKPSKLEWRIVKQVADCEVVFVTVQ